MVKISRKIPPTPVVATQAVTRDVPVYIHEIGKCAAMEMVTIIPQVAGQVTENIATQVAGHTDKGEAGCPARDPPQEVIRRDQRHEENECQPYAAGVFWPARQTIDQIFHAILRAYGTSNGRHNRREDDDM